MADDNHYLAAAAGLESAAKALRACGEEEQSEDDTSREKQPQNLRDAQRETRKRFTRARGEKPDEGD